MEKEIQSIHKGKEMCLQRATRKQQELATLVARLLATPPEEAAYGDFAHYFGPRFKALFRHRGLSEANAEDLAETCITDIALKIHKYRDINTGSFEAWVFTLARNALADWFANQLPTISLSEPAPHSHGIKPPRLLKSSPDLDVIAAVNDALEQLPETDRQLIKLRDFMADNTFEDIGQTLGISSGNARVRHYRILQRLKALLEQDPRMSYWLKRANERIPKND